MRSFFKKPAWATTENEPSAQEFYRRSHQTYDDILKANRHQRRKDSPKPSVLCSSSDTTARAKPTKRRRISDPGDDSKEALGTNNETGGSSLSLNAKPEVMNEFEVVERRVPAIRTYDKKVNEDAPTIHGQISVSRLSPEVQLVDVQPAEEKSLSPTLPGHDPISSFENLSDTHCIRDGSSTAIAKRKEQLQESSPVLANRQKTTSTEDASVDDVDMEGSTNKRENDLIVEILITSPIENTKPLIVQRLMSQRFRDVRLAWCERQGFDQKMTSSVYLTWNKRRLFDVTTCRSLDYSALSSLTHNLDLEDGLFSADVTLRIHVEAVTDQALKAQAEKMTPATTMDETDLGETENSFHIVLKSQGHADLRVKVLPDTAVQQIITNFRRKRKISPNSKVSLSFDGELLDPGSHLHNHDVADMDLVDVLIR